MTIISDRIAAQIATAYQAGFGRIRSGSRNWDRAMRAYGIDPYDTKAGSRVKAILKLRTSREIRQLGVDPLLRLRKSRPERAQELRVKRGLTPR